MKIVYDWLHDYVGEEMPEISKLDELFTFHAFEIDGIEQVGNHNVIDVKVLPDRSSDCLSHRGIARELATLVGKPLMNDPLTHTPTLEPKTEKIKVTIENLEHCRRFTGALITGVTVSESPVWLKERLEALGQRSINNVVDATNYVMLALGQPLHAYDAHTFAPTDGVWHFGVRLSREGEEVTTLSGEALTLPVGVQLIVNGSTDMPMGIAGIKGGQSSEITSSTVNVILESANFNPQLTRRSSQRIKLQTDASKRFENDLPADLAPYGLVECVSLIHKIAGGICEGYVDVYPKETSNAVVQVTLSHIHALLGIVITAGEVEDIFSRLGFLYTQTTEGWSVTAPFERTDIIIPEDIIAEVGRVYGYEHVASVVPISVPMTEYNARHFYGDKVRSILVDNGFSEVITSSFRKEDVIELQNALASDKGCLRSLLSSNMRDVLDRNMPNVDLLGISHIQVFEIGTVFTKDTDRTVSEHVALSIGVRTKQQGFVPHDDMRLSEIVEKIESELGTNLNARIDRGVLECNFTQVFTALPKPTAYAPYISKSDIHYRSYSQYPFISRDIALWVPESTTQETVETLIREKSGNLLVRLSLFDEFKKDTRISYAFRLIFQSFERTLTDDEVGTIMDSLYADLNNQGFEVR